MQSNSLKERENMNKAILKKALSAFCIVSILLTSSIYSAQAAPQPLEYSNLDFSYLLVRVEPDGEGTVFDVYFILDTGYVGEPPFAALEGYGVGEAQWPTDPGREGYTFVDWYDNPERTGMPYTMNTPIYEDTELYAKWKYAGSGGYWPRSHRGIINGIDEGSSFDTNQTVSITAEGYNMHLVTPNDQRFRWIPVSWKVTDSMSGDFTAEAPFSAEFSVGEQGDYKLYITYKEEIFDGANWQETGQIRDVEEVSFQIKNGSGGF